MKRIGYINKFNSFERIYKKWQDYMFPFLKCNSKEIIGIKYNNNEEIFEYFVYENEELLEKDNANLPFKYFK